MTRDATRATRPLNWASAVNTLAGIWLIGSGWLYGLPTDGIVNAIAVGLLIALVAVCRLAAGPGWAWVSWFNAVLGAWMIASPWIYGYADGSAAAWNSAVVGLGVLVLACVGETAPEAAATGGPHYYNPTPGWDYPYHAHPEGPGEPVWYAPGPFGTPDPAYAGAGRRDADPGAEDTLHESGRPAPRATGRDA